MDTWAETHRHKEKKAIRAGRGEKSLMVIEFYFSDLCVLNTFPLNRHMSWFPEGQTKEINYTKLYILQEIITFK